MEEFNSDIHDYTKLCIGVDNTGFDGYSLSEILENNYDIFTECSTEKYVLVYLGLLSKKSDIDSLISALKNINKTYKTNVGKKKDIIFKHIKPIIKYSMRKTLSFEKKRVEIDDSLGSVSYDFIFPYPPG